MTLLRSLCPALPFACATLLACGSEPPEEGMTTDDATTDAPTGTTGDEPTTGDAALPCGDGVVEWHHTESGSLGQGASATGVAVDGAGRIIVVGTETNEMGNSAPMVLVLDPAGTEVWRKTLGGPNEPSDVSDVVVDEADRIYVGGTEWAAGNAVAAMVRALSPDGDELWGFSDLGEAPEYGTDIGGLALGQGALFSVGTEPLDTLVIRRHDLATGEAVWKTSHSEGIAQVNGPRIAVAGARVLVVAQAALGQEATGHPFILQLDGDGAVDSFTIEDLIAGFWLDVAPIGGAGEWVLAGDHIINDGEGVAVERAGPDGASAWSMQYDVSPRVEQMFGVAVAPDERVLVVGATASEDYERQIPSVRCMAGDGSNQWQAPFDFSGEEFENESAYGGAFGPGFMVVVGDKQVGSSYDLWVRKYATQ